MLLMIGDMTRRGLAEPVSRDHDDASSNQTHRQTGDLPTTGPDLAVVPGACLSRPGGHSWTSALWLVRRAGGTAATTVTTSTT